MSETLPGIIQLPEGVSVEEYETVKSAYARSFQPSQDAAFRKAHAEYLKAQRQALLMQIDAIERFLEISPRTAELRKQAK